MTKATKKAFLPTSLFQKESSSSYLALCFILPVCLTYLLYLFMKIYPFGEGTVLVLDMNSQYVYFHQALRNAVLGDESLLYSFSRALGGEFMGMYVYYLASPLSYITVLLPEKHILLSLLIMILAKAGFCGLSFGFYLHKHTSSPNRIAIIIFSCLWALCGFAVVYQSNTMWIDSLIWLPLISYSIERLVHNRRYKLYVICLSLAIMSNYYIGYMLCIYSLLFFIYCYINKAQKAKKDVLSVFLRFFLSSLWAAGISAFVLACACHSLSLGKADFSDPSFAFSLKFNFIEFLTKFLPGTYDTVRPQGLPLVYCGILTLFLVPLYFCQKRFSVTERISSLVFISVFVLSFIVKPLDLIWHGFQSPNWLNYRYSFMLCFFLLVLGYKAFVNIGGSNCKALFAPCALIIGFTLVASKLKLDTYITSKEALLPRGTVLLSVVITALIFSLLYLLIKLKDRPAAQKISSLALAITVCGEILCNGFVLMRQLDKDVVFTTYSNYMDHINGMTLATEELEAYDGGFYRAEKNTHRKFNDNMALSLQGISGSTSTLHRGSINLLGQMGYVSRSHFSRYSGGNPVGDSILGIKYVIDNSMALTPSAMYSAVISNETYDIYLNPYALSLAFGANEDIKNFDLYQYGSHFESLNALVGAIGGLSDEQAEIFTPLSDYSVYGDNTVVSKNEISRIYSPKLSKNASVVNFEFVAPYNGEYYFYPQTEYVSDVKLRVNGVYYGDYLGAKNNSIVSLGYHGEGETVHVELEIKEDFYFINNVSPVWYFDSEKFTDAFEVISSAPQLKIDDGWTDDHLTGTISTRDENSTILTTIPYDSGWKIYVDGKAVDTYKCLDALIAFDIDTAGEHTVELKYRPTVYIVGIAVSAISIVALAFDFWRRRKATRENTSVPCWDDTKTEDITNKDKE